MKHIYIILTVLFGAIMVSCSKDDAENEPQPWQLTPTQPCEHTTLIYSVAANNLLYDLRSDSLEMIKGAPQIKGLATTNRVILYFASKDGKPTLSELMVGKDGKGYFQLLKTYERTVASTHPARMRTVWQDVMHYRPASAYGMILESHGTGWTPAFSDHSLPSDSQLPAPDDSGAVAFAFGSDYSVTANSDKTDIIELADVFADGQLDFIWFDACYMAGIENIYQLRHKANTFVGYVMEIASYGMPYDLILPLIAGQDADLVSGADTLFKYYNNTNSAVSVSVVDLSVMPQLAAAARPLARVEQIPYISFMQNYARMPNGPFYDLGEYFNRSNEDITELQDELEKFNIVLGKALKYKNISQKDFNNHNINTTVYSGISTHIPGQAGARPANEAYWFQTDWAKDAFPPQAAGN